MVGHIDTIASVLSKGCTMHNNTFKNFNPYAELGLNKDADQETIKKTYQKLVKKHHPDRGGDEEQFKRIQAAYEVLTRKNQHTQTEGSSGHGFDFDFDEEALAQEFVDEHDNIIFDFTGFFLILTDTLKKIEDDIDEHIIAEIKKLCIKICAIQEFLHGEDTRALVIAKINTELKEAGEEMSEKELDEFIQKYDEALTVARDGFLNAILLFDILNQFSKAFSSFSFNFESGPEKKETDKKYRDKYHLQRILQKYPERKQQIIDELGDDIISYFLPRDYGDLLTLLDEEQRDTMLSKLDWSKVNDYKIESVLKPLNSTQQSIVIPLLNWNYVSLRFISALANSLSELLLQTVFKHMIEANPRSFADMTEAGLAAEKLNAHAFKQYLHAGKAALSKNNDFPLGVLKSPKITEKNAQIYVDFFQPEITAFLRKKAIPTSDISPVALPFVVAELCESIKTLSDIKKYLDYVNTLPQPQVGYINLLMERIDACTLNVDHMISLLKLEREGLFHVCMVAYLSGKLPEITLRPEHLVELKGVLSTSEFDELSQKFKMEEPANPKLVQQENKNFFFNGNLAQDPVVQNRIGQVLNGG